LPRKTTISFFLFSSPFFLLVTQYTSQSRRVLFSSWFLSTQSTVKMGSL